VAKVIHQYIDDIWTDTTGCPVATLINPATGEVTGLVAQGTEADMDRVVGAI
jgi:acyl-CoA reductase-like NAD-dependent aldehyde dehydrogenase